MTNPVQRALAVTTPFAGGEDIRALQSAINDRLEARGSDYRVEVDVEFGPDTMDTGQIIAYVLGVGTDRQDDVLSEEEQEVVRDPDKRKETRLERAARKSPSARCWRSPSVTSCPATPHAYCTGESGGATPTARERSTSDTPSMPRSASTCVERTCPVTAPTSSSFSATPSRPPAGGRSPRATTPGAPRPATPEPRLAGFPPPPCRPCRPPSGGLHESRTDVGRR